MSVVRTTDRSVANIFSAGCTQNSVSCMHYFVGTLSAVRTTLPVVGTNLSVATFTLSAVRTTLSVVNNNLSVLCRLYALLLYTAISRKVVGKNVHATIPKGNMGYDQ